MPQLIVTSIGTRSADALTINSATAHGSYAWRLTASASIPATTKMGDKLEYPASSGVFYRVTAIDGADIYIRKYCGQSYTGQADPPTTSMPRSATSTRFYAAVNGTGMWNLSKPADLTTPSVEGQTGVVWNGHVAYDGARISVTTTVGTTSGGSVTTSSSCFSYLRNMPGHGFWELNDLAGADKLNRTMAGAGFVSGANANTGFGLAEANMVVEGLVNTIDVTNRTSIMANMTGANTVLRNCCLFNRNTSSGGSALANVGGNNAVFANNLLVMDGAATGDEAVAGSPSTSGHTVYILANTFARIGSGCTAFHRAAGSGSGRYVVEGNAFLGFGTLISTASNVGIFLTAGGETGYNATDLAAGGNDGVDQFPGSGNVYSLSSWSTVELVDGSASGTGDFKAKAGGGLVGAGRRIILPYNPVDSSGTSNPTVRDEASLNWPAYLGGTGDLDIAGRARSTTTPTIGCWEVTVADVTVPTKTNNGGLVLDTRTTTSLTWDWDVAEWSDNVGITGYEVSENSGAAINKGLVYTHTKSGLAQGVTVGLRVRAYDAAGNRSTYSTAVNGTTKEKTIAGVVLKNGSTEQVDLTGLTVLVHEGTGASTVLRHAFASKTTNGSGVLETLDVPNCVGGDGDPVLLVVTNEDMDPDTTNKGGVKAALITET